MFIPFFFHLRYEWLVRGRLYLPNLRCESHHKICNLRYGTPDTLLPLQVQSVALRQTPGTIGFSHRLCSVMFSLYDNKMSSIFQCIQMIFTVENTRLEIVLMNIHMYWIFQQNGISCRNGCESWDYFVISSLNYFAVRQIQMNLYLTHLRSLYPTLEKQILDLQTETK